MAEMTKEDLIDLGGNLHRDLKQNEKDLDKVKIKLREIMKAEESGESYGAEFILKATDYVAVAVDKEASIKSFIGIRTSQIKEDADIVLSGKDLILLLQAASFSVAALRKVFTEEGVSSITTKTTKHFHTLSFSAAEDA